MDYEKIYHLYYMEVYSYVLTLIGDRHMAEEIAQKTFFKAMTASGGWREESGELTWLCAIAKNLAYDEMRRQKRFAETESMEEAFPDPVSIERIVEDEETLLCLHRILHSLQEPYKEVFQLRVFGELSFGKIGMIFEKTENWARVTYHRARLMIRERMERL